MSMSPAFSYGNNNHRLPRSTSSPSVRRFYQGESSSYLSAPKGKSLRSEDDHLSKKPSMLAKVKEKARKWKQALGKKKQAQDPDPPVSWRVAFRGYGKHDDPYDLGTPMCALRHSPGSYKELVRQRSSPGLAVSEKHVLPCSLRRGYSEQCEGLIPPSPTKRLSAFREEIKQLKPLKMTPIQRDEEEQEEEYYDLATEMTLLEDDQKEKHFQETHVKELDLSSLRRKQASVDNGDEEGCDVSGLAAERKWDKGVSIREYIKNKMEPGDDERALSEVISEAICPRTPSDKGVVERVKEAFITLLFLDEQRNVEQDQEFDENLTQTQRQQKQVYQQNDQRTSNSSAYEDKLNDEEESQERFLQAN